MLAYHALMVLFGLGFAWADNALGAEDIWLSIAALPHMLVFHFSGHRIGWSSTEPAVIAAVGVYWMFILISLFTLIASRKT
ncbi:MAG: hypothetical protein AAFR11_10390 [Pseudomonadota bacterium]